MSHNRIPLLLIHGFPLDSRMWRATITRFETERPVIAPDLATLLPASRSGEPPSIAAMAAKVEAGLSPGPVALVSLSMGGYVALEFAKAFPDRVAGLVLVDTRAEADTPEGKDARMAMIASVRADGVLAGTAPLRNRWMSPSTPDAVRNEADAIVGSQPAEAVVYWLEAMRDRLDNSTLLGSIKVPALVVVGADDVVTPPALSEKMAANLPNARLVKIEGAGHMTPMEAPDAFNNALAEFLKNLP